MLSSSNRNNQSLKLIPPPPLPLSSSSILTNPSPSRLSNTTIAMEEVWEDINLTSLNEQNTRPSMTTCSTFGGVTFQDFLSIDPSSNISSNTRPLYSPAPPTPVTALSLSCSRPDFHFDSSPLRSSKDSHLVHPHHPNPLTNVSCFTATPFDSLVCTSSLPCFENKSFAEPPDCNPGERRNKRMIKNRESAARSRARKQAYTKELQLKVDHLLEENARLKRQQQQQLYEHAASQQKKNTLYRTSSAPF